MHSSVLTVKGQVTIPAEIRNQLGMHPGDPIGFYIQDDHIVLFRKEKNIEVAFKKDTPSRVLEFGRGSTSSNLIRPKGRGLRPLRNS